MTRRSVFPLALTPWSLQAKPALFEQTDLFHQGDAGVHTYRIPALIESRKGTLIAIADARHDGSGDLPARGHRRITWDAHFPAIPRIGSLTLR